jgi:hypothetical protein
MRFILVLALLIGVGGCASTTANDAPTAAVLEALYAPEGPPKLTLITVVNNRTGEGGHTALMVSGSQQVIFDPAGSFQHALVPEQGDVLYGITPSWFSSYKSAHARSTWHVVTQEIEVTPAQAEQALGLVRANGPVGSAFCTRSTSGLLRRVQGFEDISSTFYPVKLMEQMALRPGVTTEKYYEDDEGDVRDGIVAAQG